MELYIDKGKHDEQSPIKKSIKNEELVGLENPNQNVYRWVR